eukprot:TRINITY_DN6330_c0_g1_i1.p1 TRINITY_DN6330_c0_g1~~TRINITY_DN6330_c0_g1_i1.p1  ORF type:complete len:350 (+),score=68.43 TRINITY_DN6330_c0_g1_i1:22-1050(+)
MASWLPGPCPAPLPEVHGCTRTKLAAWSRPPLLCLIQVIIIVELAHAAATSSGGGNSVEAALKKGGKYSSVLKLLSATGYSTKLAAMTNITFLAPDDSAFAALPAAVSADLKNVSYAVDVLKHHVVEGYGNQTDYLNKVFMGSNSNFPVSTLYGGPITVSVDGEGLIFGTAHASPVDLLADGSISVEGIDKVLLPNSSASSSLPSTAPSSSSPSQSQGAFPPATVRTAAAPAPMPTRETMSAPMPSTGSTAPEPAAAAPARKSSPPVAAPTPASTENSTTAEAPMPSTSPATEAPTPSTSPAAVATPSPSPSSAGLAWSIAVYPAMAFTGATAVAFYLLENI